MNRITLLQNRAIRILHSAAYRDHTSPLFHRYKILKFVDIVSLENCIFAYKYFNDEAFSLFSNHFKLTASSHSYCTRTVSNGLIFKRLYNTFRYGSKSIINSIVSTWNHSTILTIDSTWQFSMVTTYLICHRKKWNHLFLSVFWELWRIAFAFYYSWNIYLMYEIWAWTL